MGERRAVDIDNLIVDEENPRFEAVGSESDALFSILEDQALASGNKILTLARSIAEDGLNASELLVVSPIAGEETYRVREGNRRVSAIKLSLDPDRVPKDFDALRPQFAALNEPMQQRRVVDCYITSDETEIRNILTLRHAGESGGIGVVRWDAVQKARFSQGGNQQTERAVSLISSIHKLLGDGEVFFTIAGIPATNIGRLISTPEVRQALNIVVDGSEARYLGGHDDLLLDVLEEVKRDGVVPIYHKRNRIRLIDEAQKRIEPDRSLQAHLPLDGILDDAALDVPPSEHNVELYADTVKEHGTGLNSLQDHDARRTTDDRAAERQEEAASTPRVSTGLVVITETEQERTVRRKPVSRNADKGMFGHHIRPKGTGSNDVYRGIDWIDVQYLKDPDKLECLLPILGCSLRLLMESVAYEYYASIGEDRGDKSLANFLKDVAKPAIKSKIDTVGRNNLALASEWIDGRYNLEAFFSKWAHGTMAVDRASLVRQSELVALIINEVWS